MVSLLKQFRSNDHFLVKDIVIKSILSAYDYLKTGFKEDISSMYSCYKILGYDIFLDSNLKAHLIGNISIFFIATCKGLLCPKGPDKIVMGINASYKTGTGFKVSLNAGTF